MLETGNLLSVQYTSVNPIFEKKEKRITECVYDVTWTVQADPPDQQHGQSSKQVEKQNPGPTPNLLDQDHDFNKTTLIHVKV